MAFGDIVLIKNQRPVGPFTRRQIQEGLSRGEFTPRDLAHTPGLKDWLPLLEVLHYLDREVVHEPRPREARTLPPLPTGAQPVLPPVPPIEPVAGENRFVLKPPPLVPREPERVEFPAPKIERVVPLRTLEYSAGRATPPGTPVFTSRTEKSAPPALPSRALEPSPMAARANAFLIDAAILFVPVLVLFGISYALWYARGSMEHRDPETARQERELLYRNLRDLTLLVANGFAWLYAAGLEASRWQGTAGKQLMGLVVTDVRGHRISFLRATGRHAAKYLSALPVFLGFMAALFNPHRLTWHDRLADTRVVKR
jgi:uncharacterized RDD family membrane protein YckC